MTASNDTVKQLADVIEKYVSPKRLLSLIADLRKVSGNKSVVTTIELLQIELRSRIR